MTFSGKDALSNTCQVAGFGTTKADKHSPTVSKLLGTARGWGLGKGMMETWSLPLNNRSPTRNQLDFLWSLIPSCARACDDIHHFTGRRTLSQCSHEDFLPCVHSVGVQVPFSCVSRVEAAPWKPEGYVTLRWP